MKWGIVLPWFEIGGMETVVLNLAIQLREFGEEIEFILTEHPGEWHNRLLDSGFTLHVLNAKDSFCRVSHFFKVARFLSCYQSDVLLINHSRAAQISLPWTRASAKLVVLHNTTSEVFDVGTSFLKFVDALICVGPNVKRLLKNEFPSTFVIPNGIVMPNELYTRQTSDVINILYVGRIFDHQKGVMQLAEICEELVSLNCRFFLKIIGSGPDTEKLLKAMSKIDPCKWEYLGSQGSEVVQSVMKLSDVVIMPSNYEGLSISLLEAMSNGCVPVVSLLPGSTDYVISNWVNGVLIERGDVRGYARAITKLNLDNELLLRMQKSAKHRIFESFSITSVARDYAQLAEKICRTSRATCYTSWSYVFKEIFRQLWLVDLVPNFFKKRRA